MSNRSGNRGKRRAGGNWTNRFTDPTPEQIAEWKAAQPVKVPTNAHVKRDEERAHAVFNAWLADPEDTRPLATVEATNATD
jgi:hypothetical protein